MKASGNITFTADDGSSFQWEFTDMDVDLCGNATPTEGLFNFPLLRTEQVVRLELKKTRTDRELPGPH